jgi:ubiquinone/menaquinone biosynthesis C-methylase UbiE
MLSWFKKDETKKAKGALQSRHPMRQTAFEYLDAKEDDVVLQIGFGSDLEILLQLVPLLPKGRIAGVESNPALLEKAMRRFNDEFSHFKVDFQNAVVSKLPFYDGSFTKVLSLEQLHGWVNIDKGLDEIHRVLAPGGLFVLVWSLNLEQDSLPAMKRTPDLEAMSHLLKGAGFYHPVVREHREGSTQYYQVTSRKP